MSWTKQTPELATWEKETQLGDWDKFKWLAFLLNEDGSYLLHGDTSKILLQSAINTDWDEDSPESSSWSKEVNPATSWIKE
jgi:hypothetical protein